MIIIEKDISFNELKKISENIFGDMVKGAIDVEKEILALDAELHSDLEALLLEKGSLQQNIWGINLYTNEDDDFIEFDSMINIRPSENNRSRSVEDINIQKKIIEIVNKKIKK